MLLVFDRCRSPWPRADGDLVLQLTAAGLGLFRAAATGAGRSSSGSRRRTRGCASGSADARRGVRGRRRRRDGPRLRGRAADPGAGRRAVRPPAGREVGARPGSALFCTGVLTSGSPPWSWSPAPGSGARGRITLGELLAFLFLVQLFTSPVQTATEVLNELQNAVAGWRRVIAVLDTPADVADPGTGGCRAPRGRSRVELRARRLRLPGRPASAARHRLTSSPARRSRSSARPDRARPPLPSCSPG